MSGYLPSTGAMGDATWPGGGGIGVDGLSTQKMFGKGRTFVFANSGFGDVQILLDGTLALDKEVPLSGLAIEFIPIPEPLSLLALTAGALAMSNRRRRD